MNFFKSSDKDIDKPTKAEIVTAKEKESDNRVSVELEKQKSLDDGARDYYKARPAKIDCETIGGKKFVTIGDVEFCPEYVCDISVDCVGEAPKTSYYSGVYHVRVSVNSATPARININYFSGRILTIECNRHALEIVLIGLRDACKDALRD